VHLIDLPNEKERYACEDKEKVAFKRVDWEDRMGCGSGTAEGHRFRMVVVEVGQWEILLNLSRWFFFLVILF
jgi:hypothetical protein